MSFEDSSGSRHSGSPSGRTRRYRGTACRRSASPGSFHALPKNRHRSPSFAFHVQRLVGELVHRTPSDRPVPPRGPHARVPSRPYVRRRIDGEARDADPSAVPSYAHAGSAIAVSTTPRSRSPSTPRSCTWRSCRRSGPRRDCRTRRWRSARSWRRRRSCTSPTSSPRSCRGPPGRATCAPPTSRMPSATTCRCSFPWSCRRSARPRGCGNDLGRERLPARRPADAGAALRSGRHAEPSRRLVMEPGARSRRRDHRRDDRRHLAGITRPLTHRRTAGSAPLEVAGQLPRVATIRALIVCIRFSA